MKKLIQSLFILLLIASTALAQDRKITGKVTAQDDGFPLPGVSVLAVGSTAGVQTDANGNYSLNIPQGSDKLTFSFIGFLSKTVSIGNSKIVNVALLSDTKLLNEVVVTGAGIEVSRRSLGNASTTVSAQEITQAKAFNVGSALTGKVAGLQVNAVSSGVNPEVRLVLRGNRSLLGNNQALVVIDNVIVPSSILGNLNPEDIETIQVLNGAGAAVLYGSAASNGALIVTTKKGKGATKITVSNTTNFETVAFLPKLQKTFGSGTSNDDVPSYTPWENQQYGPAFDGSMVQLGRPLVDGSVQTVSYSNKNAKDNFWETGLTNQTDFSMQSGDDKSSYYFSTQYFDQQATVPGDKYNRFSIRLNGTKNLYDNLKLGFNTNYVQNRYNTSSASAAALNDLQQSPSNADITKYKNWRTDPFANPNGYYNDYYDNPYFTLDNNRSLTRNDYLTGNVKLVFTPIKDLSLTYRIGLTTRNNSNKSYQDIFNFTDYTKSISSSKTDYIGSINDNTLFVTNLISDFIAEYKIRATKDLTIDLLGAGNLQQNSSKVTSVGANGLAVPGLFNVAYRTALLPNGGEANYKSRVLAVYGQARLNYKSLVYLNLSARNDYLSILLPKNRSIFYPAADLSFVASDAFDFLKNSKTIESLKLRGGVSQVSQVSLGNSTTFGAYSLLPTFDPQAGFPFSSGPAFGLSGRIVSPDLKPETTVSVEGGLDLSLFSGRLTTSATYYHSNTKDQTIPVGISGATGYSSYLTNTGVVTNDGIETVLRGVPYRSTNWEVSLGANYTFNQNKVKSISADQKQLNIGSFTNAGIYAVEGQSFPLLRGTDYNRDSQGRVIVDAITGYPTASANLVDLGQTEPKHRLGLDAAISFKNLRLSTVWEYRAGNIIYNNIATAYDFSGSGIRTANFNRERFVMPNSSYEDPANPGTYLANNSITVRNGGTEFWTDGPHNTNVGTNYVNSAAFWKCREVALSYKLPTSIISSAKYVKGATITLQGRNLLVILPTSNIYTDPEYSAAGATSNAIGLTSIGFAPPSRYFGATLSLDF